MGSLIFGIPREFALKNTAKPSYRKSEVFAQVAGAKTPPDGESICPNHTEKSDISRSAHRCIFLVAKPPTDAIFGMGRPWGMGRTRKAIKISWLRKTCGRWVEKSGVLIALFRMGG